MMANEGRGQIEIVWVKSAIGYSERQKATVRALGLRRLGDRVVHQDTPVVRGMIYKVRHLVQVREVSEP